MNNNLPGDHPAEEQLMELALTGGPKELERHCAACPTCAGIADGFRKVKESLASLGDDEVPERTERRILAITRHGRRVGLFAGLQSLIANPFFIVLAVVLVVIMLYFLVGSEVFRGP